MASRMSPLAGLGGGISWRPPAYSLLMLLLLVLLKDVFVIDKELFHCMLCVCVGVMYYLYTPMHTTDIRHESRSVTGHQVSMYDPPSALVVCMSLYAYTYRMVNGADHSFIYCPTEQ